MIKRGDLVMVTGRIECCGNSKSLGRVFTVDCVRVDTRRCSHCSKEFPEEPLAFNGRWGFTFRRLKKIVPPSTGELDGVPVRKEKERHEQVS